MSALALMALLGVTLFAPVFLRDDDDEPQTEPQTEPTDPTGPTDTVEPNTPIPSVDPVDPPDPDGAADPLLPAAATFDAASNTVTVTTDPDETGTLYTIANRIDFPSGSGDNFRYEASVVLAPEGLDLADRIDSSINGDNRFLAEILRGSGATTLGAWPFDPTAAEGTQGTGNPIPDFEYPEGIDTEFLQLFSVNFGDGIQTEAIIERDSEDALDDDITAFVANASLQLVEDNGGAIVTLPTGFTGDLVVLETTTDYFFEGQLVRTDVNISFATQPQGVTFATSALTLADQVNEAPIDAGTQYSITDGSLTEREVLRLVPDAPPLNFGYGVSSTEFDTSGAIISQLVFGGPGVSSDAGIIRFEVRATGEATPSSSPSEGSAWNITPLPALVTGFNDAPNITARDLIDGTAGDDILGSEGDFRASAPPILRGFAGDDLLVHTGADSSGPLILEGGDGNDTLIAEEVEFRNSTTLDGGAGDDILRSDIFIGGGGSGIDTFITGAGADRIEITTFNVSDSTDIALGLAAIVTDFTPGEDMILVDPSQLVRDVFPEGGDTDGNNDVSQFDQRFTLREDPAGTFTDLLFTFTRTGADGGQQMTGTIRLEGLTGITEDDIAFARLEDPAPVFVRQSALSAA